MAVSSGTVVVGVARTAESLAVRLAASAAGGTTKAEVAAAS